MLKLKQSAVDDVAHLNDYLKKKKKKEEEQSSEKSGLQLKSSAVDAIAPVPTVTNSGVGDIAPVAERKSFLDILLETQASGQYDNPAAAAGAQLGTAIGNYITQDKNGEKWYEGWFQKGASEEDVSKAIIGTSADAAVDVTAGGTGIIEGAIDWIAGQAPNAIRTQGQYDNPAAAAGAELGRIISNLFRGNDIAYNPTQEAADRAYAQATEDVAEFIKKDLIDEEAVAKEIVSRLNSAAYMYGVNQSGAFATPEQLAFAQQMAQSDREYIDTEMEEDSVFAHKTDELMQSAGQLAGTAAISATGVPWWLVSGTTAWGGEMENALKQGATLEEANLSGAISAGAEVLTEKISGGISFGGKTLDDMLTKKLAANISSKFWRYAAKLGMDMAGEGLEEVLSEDISRFGQWLTYQDENTLAEMLWSEEAMDAKIQAFLSGAALGGGGSVTSAVQSTIKGVDAVSGLTKNEQAVVDKVYKDEVAKAEKEGTVTAKQKSEIYDKVLEQMDKGYISTDTIEEVLGGDEYKTYKETVDSEDALQKEFDELGELDHPTLKQQSRYQQLGRQLKRMKKNSQRNLLKEQLSKNVYELTKGDRLSESYRESDRRYQDYQADYSKFAGAKYQDAVKKTIENAIKAGANNTNAVHDIVDFAAKVSGDTGEAFDFQSDEQTKADFIERQTKLIGELEKLDNRNDAQNKKLAELKDTLEKVKSGKLKVNGNITANGIVLNLDAGKPLNRVVGHEVTHSFEPEMGKESKEYTALKDALYNLAKAKNIDVRKKLAEYKLLYEGVEADAEAEMIADMVGDFLFDDTDFAYNLSVENQDVFQRLWNKIKHLCKLATAGSKEARELERVKKAFEDAYRAEGKAQSGTKHSISKQLVHGESENNIYIKDGHNKVTGETVNFIDLILDGKKKGETRSHKSLTRQWVGMAKDGLVYGRVRFGDPIEITNKSPEYQDAYIDGTEYGLENGETKYFYPVLETEDFRDNPRPVTRNGNYGQYKYSISDSNGNQLSKEQQEFFKDSKVRDENGNLKVMYHGTKTSGFTVFDHGHQKFGLFGNGFYFTDDPNVAEGYTKDAYGKAQDGSGIYEVYLNIKNPIDMDAYADKEKWVSTIAEVFGESTDVVNAHLEELIANMSERMNGARESVKNSDMFYIMRNVMNDLQLEKYEAAEMAEDVIRSMGYDGLTHIGGGVFNRADSNRHRVYIALNQEQIKNTDNLKPTDHHDIRYSLTDSEGTKLTKEQSEFFKDSKAVDRNGNLLKVYHTTQNDFTVFDKARKGEATQDSNTYLGFFFSDDAEYMQNFPEFQNGKTEAYYLNMKNPIDMTNVSKEAFLDIVEVLGGDVQDASDIYDEADSLQLGHLLDEMTGEFNYNDFIKELKPHYSELMSKGYDGVVGYLDEGYGVKEYIVLDSNQAKLASNTKPTADPDIRYSVSEVTDAQNELARGYLDTKDIQYSFSAVPTHRKSLEKNFSVADASLELPTIMARYDKILDIWKRLGGELDSKFLNDWNNKVERPFTVFKAQAGYKYNVELSSMCKKGVPLFEAIDTIVKKEVMKELDTDVLGKEEKEILYDILKKHHFEIPCAICYVEQARQREGVIIDAFLNGKTDTNANGEVTGLKLGWNQVLDSIQKEMKANGVDHNFAYVSRDIATDKYDPADLSMDEQTYAAFAEAVKKIANQEITRYNQESGKNRKLLKDVTPEAVKECFKGTLPSNLKIFKVLLTEPSSRFKIQDDLLYSSMTTKNLTMAHNGLYSLFNSQGGVSGYKTKQAPTVYWGEILGKKWKPEATRKEGGVRNQSNSDFQMFTLLDQAQMYMDFSAKGYYLQAYTKVLSELKLFGLSKSKINASLIPKVTIYRNADGTVDVERTMENAGLDENGNPAYDDIEGINHKEAFMLLEDPEYSKNIGGICIGYSDNHIRKLLDDDRVQLVIGFHDKTNDPDKRYRGARYAKNYNGLNEAVNKDGKTVHIGFNPYVKKAEQKFKYNKDTESFDGTVNYNGKTYTADDIPRLAADLYLEMCAKKGYDPAYKDFSGHRNYYKLLADFSLYDSQGHYAPHQKVAYDMPDSVPYLDADGNKQYMDTEEYIKIELQKELAVRDAIAEAMSDTSEDGIIPQFKAEVNRRKQIAPDRNSLSDGSEGFTPIRSDEFFGKDFRVPNPAQEIAPVIENSAPVVERNATVEDIAPVAEEYEAIEPKPEEEAQWAANKMERADKVERAISRIDRTLEYDKGVLDEEFNQKRELLKDKNAYISHRASELYNEIRNLKKGVKASELLGELLDTGYEWSSIRAALVNIKHTPGERVNVNSAIESIAREMLNDDYEDSLYNLDDEYHSRVKQLEEGAKKQRSDARKAAQPTRKDLHQGIVDDIKHIFTESGYDFDEVLKKAKNLSTFATVDNTPQRVMEKALGYKEGNILSDLTVNKVAQNETEGIKWLNSFTDRKNGLLAQISKQYNIKPGSKESAAAQMYAEGFYVGENNDIIAYGDAELAMDFPDAQVQRNIKGLANDSRIRQIYDETLAMINESRTRNAYPEIPRLDNYFLHFRAMDDTFSRLGLPFNPNDIRAKDLPTDLNGVTADLKPGQPYFASAMHRTGKRTSFDLLGGLERYLSSAKNQIYHIDDIQTLRALRNYIADTYGQANGLEGLDALSEEEAQDRIEKVYNSHLSTFAKFLNEEANILAGKTALIDRGLEGIIGRRGITFLDTVNKQVGSNMVGFNLSSSLTNFLPVAQTFAKSNKADFVKAFTQTVANKVGSVFGRGDDFAENSPVVIRRKGADRFYRTPFQKVGDAGYVFMSAVDDISTELIARTKYNELTRKGMDSQRAHYETDKWVSKLMGDRSLGQMPQLYNSKMLGLVTKFQLEVRNQLDSQFYDTIQEAKASNEDIENGLARNAKTAAKVASTFVQLAVAQHLFGKAFESVAGYNPAFDIISVLIKAFGWDDDEESEDTALDNIEQGFFELLEDLPYTSTFTGGRIPIESALPIREFLMGEDQYGNEKSRWETLGDVAPYYILPGGYGQLKKTAQGLNMFSDDHPIAGSYTDSGNLRFPVEENIGNVLQAGIFGQYASQNARDYFDNERSPLNEKQIQEFMDVGLSIQDYWRYRDGLKGLSSLAEKADYIDSLDLTDEQKNVLINNLADRKEDIDMSDYGEYGSFEEFDYASKNPEKYAFLQENNVSYNEYMNFDDDTKDAYDWAYKNPAKHTLSKAITSDVAKYRKYTGELYDIRADKDKYGNSISGSAKEKKIDYINNLDLEYGQKIILFKSLYESDDTYNYDIIDYLNSRDDISYEEMATILKELGFTVDSEGNITWD